MEKGTLRSGLRASLSSQSWPRGSEGTVISLVSFCLQGKGGGQVERPFVDQFGFDVVTCCGYLPQVSDTTILPAFPSQTSRSETAAESTSSLFFGEIW